MKNIKRLIALGFLISVFTNCSGQVDIFNKVDHHYAKNGEVKIHYVTMGKGPLILFVHGFPDFWYSWRRQMEELSKNYTVAAVDMRGYNLSDKPNGVENYTYDKLVKDLVAVMEDTKRSSAFVVAHDWGAAISWRLAIHHPELVKKLVIISVPHPKAGDKVNQPVESKTPSYADSFVSDEFRKQLTEYWMAGWVTDVTAKEKYLEAFRRSDKDALINYYKANYPTLENLKDKNFLKKANEPLPNVKMPVLIVHGKKDPYLPVDGHNNTWKFIDSELTIEIMPEAGHFVEQDESEKLTRLIKHFLLEFNL